MPTPSPDIAAERPGGRWRRSGIPSLDARLGGGLALGDNVLWVAHRTSVAPFEAAFLGEDPGCWIRSGHGDGPPVDAVTVTVELDRPDTSVARLVEAVVEQGRAHERLVVGLLDDVYARFGASAAVELYTQACPQLFDLGALAYWSVDRHQVPASVVEAVSRVAQVVLEVRPDSLRVLKAEGRPLSYQGALSKLETDGSGTVVVGGELGAGRLAEGLRRLRRERKLSQKQLAELADVTPSAISQAETARRNLSLETLLTLCSRLPVSMDELLGTRFTTRRLLARREGRPVDAHTTALCDSASLRTSIYRVQLPPREAGVPFVAHKGTETILVARGLVLVDLGDDTPVLRSGDALVVARDPVKGWTNLTNEVAEMFWILEPPDLAATPSD